MLSVLVERYEQNGSAAEAEADGPFALLAIWNTSAATVDCTVEYLLPDYVTWHAPFAVAIKTGCCQDCHS